MHPGPGRVLHFGRPPDQPRRPRKMTSRTHRRRRHVDRRRTRPRTHADDPGPDRAVDRDGRRPAAAASRCCTSSSARRPAGRSASTRIPDGFKLSVVIPVYNEERWLRELVRRVQAVPIPKEIDPRRRLLDRRHPRHPAASCEQQYDNVRVVLPAEEPGQGRGAPRRASSTATGDLVIVQDADLEYDPAEYPQLIQPILEGKADVVYRLAVHRREPPRAVLLALGRQQGADAAVEHVHQPEPDRHGDLLQGLPPRGASRASRSRANRFGFEPEVTAKIARKRRRPPRGAIYEVPISYSRPDLRGRQEDRPEGRLPGAVLHRPLRLRGLTWRRAEAKPWPAFRPLPWGRGQRCASTAGEGELATRSPVNVGPLTPASKLADLLPQGEG